ncbi:MAG TPA: hypothetical protein VGU20_05445 [Stellaceae bacterium]|nr:hypothetical protein [Stellaceae bacterium]
MLWQPIERQERLDARGYDVNPAEPRCGCGELSERKLGIADDVVRCDEADGILKPTQILEIMA